MTPASCIFVPATLADVAQLATLEVALFHTDRCSKKSFRYLIKHTTVIVVKRKEAEEIVGYAILLGRKNSNKMRIYSFGIVATARHEGLAANLLTELEAIARKAGRTMLTLEVGDSNTAALHFYQKHGFHQCGFRLGFYEDGGHAILMRKSIKPDASDT